MQSIRKLLGTLLLVAVFGGAYYALSYVDFFSAARITRETVEQQTAEIEAEQIAILNDLERITLDGSVFASKEYQALTDITVVLGRQQASRANPFASY